MKIGNLAKNKFLNILSLNILRQIVFGSIIVISISCTSNNSKVLNTFVGGTMGTTYSVKYIYNEQNNSEKVRSKVDSILADLNQQMSTYIESSDLSKFNNSRDTNWYILPKQLINLMNAAKRISIETDGYYDITVGPIVNLWGFGPQAVPSKIPSDNAILKAKSLTGIDNLKIELNTNRIKKLIPELYCDLSSIAKGYGVDKIGLYLESMGIDDYMVEIGGEVRTRGNNYSGNEWRIGISSVSSNDLQQIVSISNVSIATSGDYFNYYEKDGIRYSHLIDSKTGKPITHNLASVTVIHEECYLADAYATSINVMGPELGYELAVKKKLPIFMIVREGNNFIEKMTPEFENYIFERN